MKIINTDNAPKAIGPYSQAVMYGNLLFISGQIAIDPFNQEFINGTIEEQTERIMENIKAILGAAGMHFDNVLKTAIYLKNMDDFQKVNEIYGRYFDNHKPARVTVGVSDLPKGALIEIDVIAGL